RDALLRWIGFTNITYDPRLPTRVISAEPTAIPAVILAQMVEVNGRPVSYVLVQPAQGLPADGAWVLVDEALLDRTLNVRLLSEGQAYYTVYTSTPVSHRRHLRAAAAKARAAGSELWRRDTTAEWLLTDQESIGPNGQLILPKLFRRCTDYLRAVD